MSLHLHRLLSALIHCILLSVPYRVAVATGQKGPWVGVHLSRGDGSELIPQNLVTTVSHLSLYSQ